MSVKVRTFIAAEIPREVQGRAGTLIARLQNSAAKVKWVEPDQLHWTLKFLGDVELEEIPAVCARVTEAVAGIRAFDVEARGAGAFPDPRRPRTVWLGVSKGADEMSDLHAAVERSLVPLGYRAEGRKFRPHVTIGRVRNSPVGIAELGQLIAENADFDGGVSTVFEVVVFSSELHRSGPTHEPLAHIPLSGG